MSDGRDSEALLEQGDGEENAAVMHESPGKVRLYHPLASDRQHRAEEALVFGAREQVRRRLASRGAPPEEWDDLCQEALERLFCAARRREAAGEGPIGNLDAYALTVADSVFEDYLRRTRPNWSRLKRRLVYLLDGKAGGTLFARWKLTADWLGGFARWRGLPFLPTSRYHTLQENRQAFCQQALADHAPDQTPLPELLASLCRWLGTPLEINDLTTRIAALQNLGEPAVLALEGGPSDNAPERWLAADSEEMADRILDSLSDEAFCARLWQIIGALPVRQRVALLLGMTRDELLLLAHGGALAAALEWPLSTLQALWPSLPLADAAIAPYLDATPKQVANLRKCARERIARWLAKTESGLNT